MVRRTILAGDEFGLPADSPSSRIDSQAADSPYNFVGSLEIFNGSHTYIGTGSLLSPNWVLTAGHNVDLNDDGQADDGLTLTLHLPGIDDFVISDFSAHPEFTGFANPSIHHDLALLYLEDGVPGDFVFPTLGLSMEIDDVVTLVGFGRSGYGSYGYTTDASFSDRRVGANTIDTFDFESEGDGQLFSYEFYDPDDPLSLGNDIETIIGPGDSGGPALIASEDGFGLVGVNTFTQGYGGRFGDIGGGIVLDPYWDWIWTTTGLYPIPEPSTVIVLMLVLGVLSGTRNRFIRKSGL